MVSPWVLWCPPTVLNHTGGQIDYCILLIRVNMCGLVHLVNQCLPLLKTIKELPRLHTSSKSIFIYYLDQNDLSLNTKKKDVGRCT